MKILLSACLVVLMQTGFPAHPSAQVSQSGSGSSTPWNFGTFSGTRPVEQMQLMESRNAALLGAGPVDPDHYLLGPGDLIGFQVAGAVSISGEDVVGSDGSVTLPEIGTLSLGGMTLTEARARVAEVSGKVLGKSGVFLLLKSMRTFKVYALGHVATPGSYVATPTTRVSEILALAGADRMGADIRNIRVTHRDGSVDRVDLLPYIYAGSLEGNRTLQDGDIIFMPFLQERIEFRGPLLYPGRIAYVPGDELGALLEILQFRESTDRNYALIQRYTDGVHWDTLTVDLAAVLRKDIQVPLRNHDRILLREVGDWQTGSIATVRGAVRYPGPIPVRRGRLNVREAIRMAGDYLDDAVPERVILGRPFLPDSVAVPDTPARNFMGTINAMRLHESVIDLSRGDGPLVEPGDLVTVPRLEDWIEILGQVRNPGFYNYVPGWEIDDYIDAAGGYGKHADKGMTRLSRGRFGDVAYAKDAAGPAPGDIIWVPERSPRTFWGFVRDFVSVGSQAVALLLIVREAVK